MITAPVIVLKSTVAMPNRRGAPGLRDEAPLCAAVSLATAAVATVKTEPNAEVATPAPELASVNALPPSLVIIVTAFPPTAVVQKCLEWWSAKLI